jgi:hypothetical protein
MVAASGFIRRGPSTERENVKYIRISPLKMLMLATIILAYNR